MKHYFTLVCLLFYIYSSSQSLEMGVFGGISNYMGDLQQTKFEMNTLGKARGAFLRYNFNNYFSAKTHFYKGEISGRDSNYEELTDVHRRNLSFKSNIWELGFQGEFTFLSFGENEEKVAAPYLFAGISVFRFNPRAEINGEWIDLQPLGTEGQGIGNSEKYSLLQIAIPLGVGFNITMGRRVNIGFEAGFRKTFTDYLDDVSGKYPDLEMLESQDEMAAKLSYRTPEIDEFSIDNPKGMARGSSADTDLYFFGGVTVSVILMKFLKN